MVTQPGKTGVTAGPEASAAADLAAVKQACLDYVEGWYEGNAARMERALHPALQKRIVEIDPASGKDRLREMSAAALVQYTRDGGGKSTPQEGQQKDVTVFDVYRDEASARIIFRDWVDYLHLGRIDGRWVIVNVLWEYKAGKKQGR
ncbi:MAG: nuclear transport factor 2 family protein [Gammaproteobacteria bacterium]|nr:nuclear transport factor 2 family protein [Gammaproteobacteria bacterium]